jgi:hypothetical protein
VTVVEVPAVSTWKLIAALGGVLMAQLTTCAKAEEGRVFYVDSAAGKDANPGDSPTLAWASLDRVNGAALQPGDTVRFKRGGVWRGTLLPRSGTEGAPITYSAYGEGEKPLLLGSVAKDEPADWEKTGENVWATAAPIWTPKQVVADLRQSDWSYHREQGAEVATRVVENVTGRTHVVECRNSGSRSNHLQAWGPALDWEKAADAEFLRLRFRARCTEPFRLLSVRVMRSGSPWTSYASADTAGLEVPADWRDYEVSLRISSKGDLPRLHFDLGGALPAGATFEFQPLELVALECSQSRLLDVDVGNLIFDQGRWCGWKRWKLEDVKRPYDYWYDGRSLRVYVCCERNPAEAHDSVELALRRHIVDQSGKHDVVYDGLGLRYGAAHGFGGGGTARLIIRNCDLSYIGGGHQFTAEGGRPVRFGNAIEFWGAARDHLVEGCRIWEVYDAALTNQGRGPDSIQENITYRNNVIWNSEYSFEYWNGPATARTRNIRFVNNTCVNAGVVWSHAQRPDRNGSHLMFYSNTADTAGIEIKYNVFYNSTEWASRYSAGWDPLPDMDYNAWYVPAGELCYFFREHLPGGDVAGYREKTGLDQHSFFGDPKLIDPANGDYRLAPDSPVRNLRPDGGPMGATLLAGG